MREKRTKNYIFILLTGIFLTFCFAVASIGKIVEANSVAGHHRIHVYTVGILPTQQQRHAFMLEIQWDIKSGKEADF